MKQSYTVKSTMLAMLLRVTLLLAIFVNHGNCETDQEFKDTILEKIRKQDDKIIKQDDKIQQLETENTVLKLKLESYQSQFQESLDIAQTKIEVNSLGEHPLMTSLFWVGR